MPVEEDFLRKLHDTPSDDTSRLVYADWLEEQGDEPSKLKAKFIRFELEAAALPDKALRQAAADSRLRKQAAALDPRWLAVVSHPTLVECRLRFEFECPKQWEKLSPTADRKVRFCDKCRQNVHHCDTIDEARDHAWKGECVAVSLALVRREDDLARPVRPLMAGRIRVDPLEIERLRRAAPVRQPEPSPDRRPSLPPDGEASPIRPPKSRRNRRRIPRQDRDDSAEESDERRWL